MILDSVFHNELYLEMYFEMINRFSLICKFSNLVNKIIIIEYKFILCLKKYFCTCNTTVANLYITLIILWGCRLKINIVRI